MEVRAYSITDLYQDLSEALATDKTDMLVAENEADQKSYDTQKNFFKKLLELGTLLVNTWSPFRKISLGEEMKVLPGKFFSSLEGLPELNGTKSASFAKQVYLPHLKRGLAIQFSTLEVKLASLIGTNVAAEKKSTEEIITKLEKNILIFEKFKQNASSNHSPALFDGNVRPAPKEIDDEVLQSSSAPKAGSALRQKSRHRIDQ